MMKNFIYKTINRLGYRIENKRKYQKQFKERLISKFKISDNFELFVRAEKFIDSLSTRYKDISFINHKDGFIAKFSNFQFYLESAEEFFILNEVFVENDYNYNTNSKSIIIDIGANIGISSLYFSQFDYVEKIYSFEPVYDTFKQAEYNISLNSKKHKVEKIANLGLGDTERTEIFLFNKSMKGNTGIRGKLSPSYSNVTDVISVDVQIKSASVEIEKIISENPNRKIVVKMDCEGAEYEIFDNLKRSGIIDKIDVFMLEWHDKGATIIENILIDSNFEFFSKTLSPISGLIYGYRNEKKS